MEKIRSGKGRFLKRGIRLFSYHTRRYLLVDFDILKDYKIVRRVKRFCKYIKIIFLSNRYSAYTCRDAVLSGADIFLLKTKYRHILEYIKKEEWT
jgi:hypothetical protein